MQAYDEQTGIPRAARMFWAPGAVLGLSLFATGLAAYSVLVTSRARDEVSFRTAIRWTQDVIDQRLQIYSCGLMGGAAFFAVDETPTRAEFNSFAERLNLHNLYPGIQGFGFARRTLPQERQALEEAMHAQGQPTFEIRPGGERGEYFPILYLEPLDARNLNAIGYDMFSEPVRQQAMVRARDTGEPAASSKVILVQEIGHQDVQAGFLLYVPVYRGGKIPNSQRERREKLLGFVYSPFRTGDLFSGIFRSEEQPEVHFEVFDGPSTNGSDVLYSSRIEASPKPTFTRASELGFAGHRWTLKFTTTTAFQAASYQRLVPWVVGTGILLSLALAAITAALAKAHQEVQRAQADLKTHAANLERTVDARTARLRETIAELEHMSYSIVHDMRAPLRAIQSFGGLLEDEAGPALSAQCRTYISRMKIAANRMDALIRDVLNYGRIVREEVPLYPVDLNKLLLGIIQTYPDFQPSVADIHVQPTLPRVLGNEGALTQCFSNLLSNAVKFNKPSQKPNVSITGEQRDGMIQICVADEGIGIPREMQGKVFGLFQRLSGSNESTGIGLAIVRKAVERMGGTIKLESDAGHGAKFHLAFREGSEANDSAKS